MLSHFFRKRSVYLPTWKLWLLMFVLLIAAAAGVVRFLYPFLAVSQPVEKPEVIVIDGWVSDQTLEAGMTLAREESCDVILTAGGDLAAGHFLSDYKTYAHLGEATLEAMGAPADEVHPAPAGANFRHRSFASAAAVYQWLERKGRLNSRITIITEGPHGRRSLAVYRKVFAETGAETGVISTPPLAYDPESWWKTSAGMKSVIVEAIAAADELLRDSGRATNDPRTVKTGIEASP